MLELNFGLNAEFHPYLQNTKFLIIALLHDLLKTVLAILAVTHIVLTVHTVAIITQIYNWSLMLNLMFFHPLPINSDCFTHMLALDA